MVMREAPARAVSTAMARAAPPAPRIVTRRVGHFPQRLQEPLAVGVLAHQFLAVHHHAVDGLHDTRGLAQTVQVGDDGDLAGHGAVAAAEAQNTHGPHGLGQPLVAQLEVDVAPVQAVMAKGLLQHVLGGIVGQVVAEAEHKLLSEVPLPGHGLLRLRKGGIGTGLAF